MIEINSNWNMAARSSASTSRIAVSVSAIVERVISTECRHSVAVDRIATMVARGPSTSWPDPCSTVLSAPSRTTMGPAIGGNDLTIRRKWEGFVYDLRKRLAEEALRLRLADRAEPRWEAKESGLDPSGSGRVWYTMGMTRYAALSAWISLDPATVGSSFSREVIEAHLVLAQEPARQRRSHVAEADLTKLHPRSSHPHLKRRVSPVRRPAAWRARRAPWRCRQC